MATPFFRGNYGSALSRVDTRPIIEAGRARGQMFANMGAQVGGMIKEYGLNKEKQKKQKANIKSTVNFLDSLTKNDPEMEDQYASMKEQLLNEDISLTERSELASQGLKQVSLSSQLQSQRLNQDTARLANEFAEETRNVRQDMLGQQRDFGEIRNKLQSLNLDKVEQLQPSEIKATLAKVKSIIDTMPSLTKATISQAEGVVREERAGQAREDLLGGPEGVAAQQLTAEKSALAGTDARTDYTKALTKRLELLSKPVDTSIQGNVDIAKSIDDVTKDIQSILKSSSMERDEDGEPLTIEDLIEDVSLSGEITFSEDANKITGRELIRLEGLLKKKFQLQGEAKTFWIDGNGNRVEGTVAEREELIRKQRLKNAELKRKQEEERIRKEKDFILKQDIG